jgi:cell wall-associated NlpC family hydrolase
VPAFGVPSSKREQAVAAKRQVDRLDARVEAAAEAYNEAADQLFGLRSEMSTLQKRIAKTGKRIDSLQGDLNARAWSMYRNGPVTFLEVLLQAESFDKFAATWDILKSLNKQDANAVIELNAARKEAKAARSELAKKERAAKRQVDIMADRKHSIEGQLAERKNILRGLEGEIAAMEAADAAAAARRASQASYTPVIEQFFPPPSRAARGEIVSVAMRYLGAPYRWGADGPNSFDCSGFTMFVYRQVGVSLPHNSGAQFGSGERVSRSDLQPGDLVFFGSPIHHVGIYVGGGSYIHSPRTGDVVRVATLDRGDYAGAVRP